MPLLMDHNYVTGRDSGLVKKPERLVVTRDVYNIYLSDESE